MPSKKINRVSDRGVALKGQALKGKKIAVAVCGGVAAVEAVKIIREIRRFEAEVQVFVTTEVKKFITKLPLEWASHQNVIEEPSAEVEYLKPFDAVLVCPATLNTIAKSAIGIADNAVTLLIASQWTTAKVLFVPTMNLQMWEHPRFAEHQTTLKKFGARFFPIKPEEDRLKMPPPEKVVEWLIQELKT